MREEWFVEAVALMRRAAVGHLDDDVQSWSDYLSLLGMEALITASNSEAV